MVRKIAGIRASGVMILLYHRITSLELDPFLLSVSPEHFAQHLEILRQDYEVLSLQEVVRRLIEHQLPQRGVALTFDDGYGDVLRTAKPLLEAREIPATVFVTTGYMGETREAWWDELEQICFRTETLPPNLTLKAGNHTVSWEMSAERAHRRARTSSTRWDMYAKLDPTGRHRLYRILYEVMKPLPPTERDGCLEELIAWARTVPVRRATHAMLTEGELRALAEGHLVDLGAHTVNHPRLATLPIRDQRSEMWQSKVRIEELIGRPVTAFAYPYGAQSDFGPPSVSLVSQLGFHCACTNCPGIVQSGADRFQLPRCEVQDYDGETFARHLRDWWVG